MPRRPCTLCCLSCSAESPISRLKPKGFTNPYEDLYRFLPAGTISISLPAQSSDISCSHEHAIDGWHTVSRIPSLETLVEPNSDLLVWLRQVQFLVAHNFIAATCRLDRILNILHCRIYLIPWDLKNVDGRLRLRHETGVVGPARRYLQTLLPDIIQDDESWEGCSSNHRSKKNFLKKNIDNYAMADIYNALQSPRPSPVFLAHDIPGIRSTLFRYQKHTIATMLTWELELSTVINPIYIPVAGVDDSVFYLQPETLEVLQEQPRITRTCGGILCEELGTGKTVMILGLILATLDQMPAPEPVIFGPPRPIVTPLSIRQLTTANDEEARKWLRQTPTVGPVSVSLVEHLVHFCSIHADEVGLRQHQDVLEQRGLWGLLTRNVPFYYHHNNPVPRPLLLRSRRAAADPGPRIMYVSSATIVVVPDNLFHQWKSEILKHCIDGLQVLEVGNGRLPHAMNLASQYDIILMTYRRFSLEASANKVTELHSWSICKCPLYHKTHVPDCKCDLRFNHSRVSPLLQIRWKRLVIDEGHVSASKNTNLISLSRVLSVERKWIVTGTPTPNLLGLNHGKGSELQYPEETDNTSHAMEDKPNVVSDEKTSESNDHPTDIGTRDWTKSDRDDLLRLSNMMSHFLGVAQFAADPDLFRKCMTAPLMARGGPRPGAVEVLTQVMGTTMIRHRVEDIEDDVLLPLLNRETVLLDLGHYGRKTYNVMQAMIVINAVDSERKDQDYLFHPSNAALLNQLVDNISQVLFWHIDDLHAFHVDDMAKRADDYVANADKRSAISEQDRKLLHEALVHAKSAAADGLWRAMQQHAYVYHRVDNLPDPKLYLAWDSCGKLLRSDRLQILRQYIVTHPLSQSDHLILHGEEVKREETQRLAMQKKRRKDVKDDDSVLHKELRTGIKHAIDLRERQEELRREYQGMMSTTVTSLPSGLLHASPLVHARIGQSTSTKLDFILHEIQQYSGDEKFLIFSRSPLTLAYVAEGLELMGTKYLQFTTKLSCDKRQHNIVTFETSDLYRVFLMELQHGARGLNLTAASRVIFCEPVWQADVESQAIKRVHRIGQTKPVTVKTLAIRSTAEEVMVTRRDAFLQRGITTIKQPKLTEDARIRDFIANPTFLSEGSGPRQQLSFPLFDLGSPGFPPINGTSAGDTVPSHITGASILNIGTSGEQPPPRKKARVVKFADD